MSQPPINLAAIGCGSRVQTYVELAAKQADRYRLVAVADPVSERRKKVIAQVQPGLGEKVQEFDSADKLLAAGKLADLVVIGTQDNYHYEPCKKAIKLGYDVLLEKPIAKTLAEAIELRDLAVENDVKVIVCHVLRYTPFYCKVREIVQSGRLGEIVSVNAKEGVGPWHFAHSYVRGHWASMADSTPLMVAKCCHDMDILSWILNRSVESVSSFGQLSFFNAKNRVIDRALRCVDWPDEIGSDPYDARQYATGKEGRRWLATIHDDAKDASDDEILEWLKEAPWGRDVFQCDNDQPDHQVMAMKFEGGLTGTFTVTAFDEGRELEIFGTKGRLRGGDFYKKMGLGDLIVTDHFGESESIALKEVTGGYQSHGGGDAGLISALYDQVRNPIDTGIGSSIVDSVHSHVIAFAAEHARRTEQVVSLDEFEASVISGRLKY